MSALGRNGLKALIYTKDSGPSAMSAGGRLCMTTSNPLLIYNVNLQGVSAVKSTGNLSVLHPVKQSNKSLARDAASIRKLTVKTLRDFRQGKISIQEAHHVSTLSKRALDAMKIEVIAGPPIQYIPLDDDDE